MVDEINTPSGNEGAPVEGSPVVPTGEASTPKAESWEKIDVNKLSPEELKHYKFFQGHFTKATQKFADEKRELSTKLQSYESSLNDQLLSPLAQFRATGKFPENFDKNAFASQLNQVLGFNQEPQGQAADPNVPYVDESTKNYFQSLISQTVDPLKKENQQLKAFVDNETRGRAEKSMNEYRESLKNDDPKLLDMFDKFAESGALIQALRVAPFSPDFKARLKYAFDGLAGDKRVEIVVEKSKAKLLEELKNKDAKERPITGGSGGGVANVNPKNLKEILSQEFDKVGQ